MTKITSNGHLTVEFQPKELRMWNESVLTILDIVVSCFILTPITVLFWATVWEFVLRNSASFPIWWALGVCWTLLISTTLVRDNLYEFNQQIKGWPYKLFSRFYIYFCTLVGVLSWRCLWFACEELLDFKDTIACLIVGLVPFLFISGSLNNLLALPYSVVLDHHRAHLTSYVTVFQVKSNQNLVWYIVDCIFSVCVVGTLVVFVWRGHWTLLEIYLYPGQTLKSALASLAIGYLLVITTFLLQPAMKYLARTLKGLVRLIVVDIYLLISFSGTINVWRGIWNSINYLFLSNLPLLSFFITHCLCFLLLVLINSSNSILVRGVYIDGQEDGSQCVEFPCYYIRLFFQERRKKKLLEASGQRRMSHKLNENETLLTVSKAPEIVTNHSTVPMPSNPA